VNKKELFKVYKKGGDIMGFLIKAKTREGNNEVIIKGSNKGGVEFAKEVTSINEKTGEEQTVLVGYNFFASIDMALDKLFRMRCCNRDAETLQELLANVKEERRLLHEEFEGILPQARRARR